MLAGFVLCTLHFHFKDGLDDDFITLWSGETLGRDWWFINYNGERSEMTSSILAALFAKLMFWINPDATYLLNRVLLFVFAPAALLLVWIYRHAVFPDAYARPLALAVMIAAASSPVLQRWSISGLETPLHAFLITWYALALIDYIRRFPNAACWPLILLQAALILVRVEGVWIVGVTFLALLNSANTWPHIFRRPVMYVYLAPLLMFLALIGARYAATGFMFPNPFYAKLDGSLSQSATGLDELENFYDDGIAHAVLMAGMLSAWVWIVMHYLNRQRPSLPLLVFTVIATVQDVLFALAGGSYGLYRLLAPTLLIKWCVCGCVALIALNRADRHARLAIGGLIVALLVIPIALIEPIPLSQDMLRAGRETFAKIREADSWADLNWRILYMHYVHRRDMRAVYPFIRDELPRHLKTMKELRISSFQAGFFPYYVKKLYPDAPIRFYDTKGLMDAKVGLAGSQKDNVGVITPGFAPLLKEKDKISQLFQEFNPNMIYVIRGLRTGDEKTLPGMGWKRAYVSPRAAVWIKTESD